MQPWVRWYCLVVGILNAVSFNLLAIYYVYAAAKLKEDQKYVPKFMLGYHAFMAVVGLITAVVLVSVNGELSFQVFRYKLAMNQGEFINGAAHSHYRVAAFWPTPRLSDVAGDKKGALLTISNAPFLDEW